MDNEIGQSLIEVLVVVTVGVLVVTALVFATIFSLRNAQFAKNSSQATKLAQEGIERVRTGRDRKASINDFQLGTPLADVNSWDDDDLWSNRIHTDGSCDDPSIVGSKCYFNVGSGGILTNIGFAFVPNADLPLPTLAEGIPAANPVFKRVILLSDDSTSYATQKTVTVIVRWTDFAGPHESKLTTILRKI